MAGECRFDSIINNYLITNCAFSPQRSRTIGVVVHSSCNYFDSVAFPAILDLGLRVNKLGKSSVTYEVGVFEQGKEEVKVVGGYTHVFIERGGRKVDGKGMEKGVREGLRSLLGQEEAPKWKLWGRTSAYLGRERRNIVSIYVTNYSRFFVRSGWLSKCAIISENI